MAIAIAMVAFVGSRGASVHAQTISNASFESACSTEWTSYQVTATATITCSTSGDSGLTPQNGTKYTKVAVSANARGGVRQTIGGLTNGQNYTVSAYFARSGNNVTGYIGFDLTGGTTRPGAFSTVTPSANNTWALNSAPFTASGTSVTIFLEGSATAARNIYIDNVTISPCTAPSAPVLSPGSTSVCPSSTGNMTTATITSGATVTWTVPASVGTITAGQGTATVTWTAAATPGGGSITATQQFEGCTSPASTAETVTILSPPAAPAAAPDLDASSDTGSSDTDNLINVLNGLVFTGPAGTVQSGATVKIHRTNASILLGTGTAAGDGSYSVTTTTALNATEGNKNILATQTDANNCQSALSLVRIVTLDTTAPVVASLSNILRGPVTMQVTFTELNGMGLGATTPSNYTLSGTGMGGLSANPDSVALNGAASPNPTYTLTWNTGEMTAGGDLTITVASGVQDKAGNVMGATVAATCMGCSLGPAPTISNIVPGSTCVTGAGATISGNTTADVADTAGNGIIQNNIAAIAREPLGLAGDLVVNGGAELGIASSWTLTENPVGAVNSSAGILNPVPPQHGGSSEWEIEACFGAKSADIHQPITVTPNQWYYAGLYAATPRNTSASTTVSVTLKWINGTIGGAETQLAQLTSNTGNWTWIGGWLYPTSSTVTLRVYMALNDSGPCAAAYVDDIHMYPGIAASSYSGGTATWNTGTIAIGNVPSAIAVAARDGAGGSHARSSVDIVGFIPLGACDDSNPCTTDTCVSGSCVHTNNTDSCDDGSACTQDDTCQAGDCVGTPIAPIIISAESVKTHNSIDYGIPMSDSECRSGGITTLLVTFDKGVLPQDTSLDAGDEVTVSSTPASGVAISGVTMLSGTLMQIDLTGAADRTCVEVTVQDMACDVNGSPGEVMAPVLLSQRIVVGDTTNNGRVTSADVNETKAEAAAVTGSNFRNDVDLDGTVDDTDVNRIKGSTNGVAVDCP